MADQLFTVTDEFSAAMHAYRRSRGGSMSWGKVINRAMSYLVSFAMAKTPVADRAKMEAVLSARTTGSSRLRVGGKKTSRSKSAQKYRGTVAAAIAFAINYKSIRNSRSAASAYALVNRFVKRRLATVGYHRSGFVPALKRLKSNAAATGDLSRRFKTPPGSVRPAVAADPTPEATVTNFARSIGIIAPAAFTASEAEVVKLLQKWTLENLNKSLTEARLNERLSSIRNAA